MKTDHFRFCFTGIIYQTFTTYFQLNKSKFHTIAVKQLCIKWIAHTNHGKESKSVGKKKIFGVVHIVIDTSF